jgi:hypothetical protein
MRYARGKQSDGEWDDGDEELDIDDEESLEIDDEVEVGLDEEAALDEDELDEEDEEDDEDEDDEDEEDDEDLDGDDVDDDAEFDADSEVTCPYCGETITVLLDPGSGATQEYVEDCEVCCRPWRVRVRYNRAGRATVHVEPAQ